MITIKTMKDAEKLIKDGVLKVDDNLKIEILNFKIDANINARNIDAVNINAGDIDAVDINAGDINAGDINAEDIHAGNIDAVDIDARNIDAVNINASGNISYWAFCISKESLKCVSIDGRRDNSIHKCLDKEIEYNPKKEDIKKRCTCKKKEICSKCGGVVKDD